MCPATFLDSEVDWDKMTCAHEQVFLASQPGWLYADCLLGTISWDTLIYELDLGTVWDCANAVGQKHATGCF